MSKKIKVREATWYEPLGDRYDEHGCPISEFIGHRITVIGDKLALLYSGITPDSLNLITSFVGDVVIDDSSREITPLELAQICGDHTRCYGYDEAAQLGWQLVKSVL